MTEKTLEKEIELREWQKMFNPSKVEEESSVLLRKKSESEDKSIKKSDAAFCW